MEAQKSTILDWIIFLISTVAFLLMAIYVPQWCWVTIPFVGTYLVKATGNM